MKLFLSYAHVNIALVKPVVDILRLLGHDPWFDDALIGGKPWQDQLRDQIVAADAFLFLVTPDVIASEWCTWEFVTAVSFNKPIIPVLLTATKLPVYVSQLQFVDLTELNPASEAKLAIALHHAAPPSALQASDIPPVPDAPAGKPARAEIVQTATVSGRNNINAQVGTNSGTININAPAPARTPLIVLGLLIIAGILVVLIIALLPTDQRDNLLYKVALVPASPTATITLSPTYTPTATFTPSNTPTVTPTFTPSNTPLAGSTAVIGRDSGELLILFARFKPDCSSCALEDPYNEWTANLQEVTHRDNSVKARVLQLPIEIDDEATARKVSDQYQATIVIWGDVGAGVVRSNYTITARWSQVQQTITNGTFRPSADIDNTMRLYVSTNGGDTEYVLDAVAAQLAYFGNDNTSALSYMDKAIALAADPIRTDRALALGVDSLYFYEGYIYSGQKQYDSALKAYSQAIGLSPSFTSAYNNRAVIYDIQKQYDLALADDTKAIALDPTIAQVYYNRGLVYLEQKQYDLALVDLDKAISLDPKNADAYNNRGNVYDAQNKFDPALSDFNQAIVLSPTNAAAYLNRGNVYAAQNKFDLALADYNKAILLDPALAGAYYNRGKLYAAQNNSDQALADYNKAIALNPAYVEAYNNRGTLYYAQNKFDLALADLNQAISLDSTYAPAYSNRGTLYYAQKQYDLALADYNQALTLDPTYVDAYTNRGSVYDAQNKPNQALADYNKAISLDATAVQAYYSRGNLYAQQTRYDLALADYNTVISLNPAYAFAYGNRGTVYYLQGQYALALADIQKYKALTGTSNVDQEIADLQQLLTTTPTAQAQTPDNPPANSTMAATQGITPTACIGAANCVQ